MPGAARGTGPWPWAETQSQSLPSSTTTDQRPCSSSMSATTRSASSALRTGMDGQQLPAGLLGANAAGRPQTGARPAGLPGWRLQAHGGWRTLSRVAASLTDPHFRVARAEPEGAKRNGVLLVCEKRNWLRQKQRWLKCKVCYPGPRRSPNPSWLSHKETHGLHFNTAHNAQRRHAFPKTWWNGRPPHCPRPFTIGSVLCEVEVIWRRSTGSTPSSTPWWPLEKGCGPRHQERDAHRPGDQPGPRLGGPPDISPWPAW